MMAPTCCVVFELIMEARDDLSNSGEAPLQKKVKDKLH